jgi:hypothetical protein
MVLQLATLAAAYQQQQQHLLPQRYLLQNSHWQSQAGKIIIIISSCYRQP